MSAIRALAAQLARRSDDDLRRLLSVRPDLILPAVPDFAALAARASTRSSLQRALDDVTRPELQILETVAVLGEDDGGAVDRERLSHALPDADPRVLDRMLCGLVDRALLTEDPAAGLLPVGALTEALGPYPARLGRSLRTLARSLPRFGPALVRAAQVLAPEVRHGSLTPAAAARVIDDVIADPHRWDGIVASAPAGAAALLSRLRDAPVGSTASVSDEGAADDGGAAVDDDGGDTATATGGAAPAVRWLLDRCLLAPLDALHVELPRGVGIAVRGHAVFTALDVAPDLGTGRTTRPALRDNAAFGAIAETLRLMTALLGCVAATPVATLRSGGVGVRELRRIRDALHSTEAETAWLLELGAAAGLLTLDPDDSRWKTARPDAWELLDRDAQWLLLVEAWLAVERAPALVGSRSPDGTAVNALAAEASRPDAPMVRRRLLTVARDLTTAGGDPAPHPELPVLTDRSVIALASWHQPRLQRRFTRLLPGMLTEASSLGLIGSGALTEAGRLLAEGLFEDAARTVREALPAPVPHVVLQADLTAVAPGYLEPDVARGLLRMSTPEGRGPATTYRFSAESVRAALDAGEDAPSILAFLAAHSATGIPQALTYLIEDTAARYGSVRVGRAGSYLRTEDDAVVAAVLADPRAAVLGITLIAPTVLVSSASSQELAALLRDLGFSPATDRGPSPAAPATRTDRRTGPPRRVQPGQLRPRPGPWTVAEEEVSAQLATLRADRPGPADRAAASDSDALVDLETLRAAIRSRSLIRLGTADSDGNHVRQLLVPLSVSGGRLRVFDPEKQVEKVVSVHRVMDVEILEGSPADG